MAVVLVVDDQAASRELLEAHLGALGHDVRHARDGVEALELVGQEEPDLILLDIDMPRMDGITLCRALKGDPLRRLIPVVLITALGDRDTRLRGLEAGADDFMSKPFDRQELLVRTKVLLRDRQLNKRLDASDSVILALARVIEARDLYTVHHAERVGLIARAMGKARSLSDDAQVILYRGGVLHDVGKAVIPAEILLKRGPLAPEEEAIMHKHAVYGERICAPLRSVSEYLPVIRHHHERWDGQGYPDHLTGKDIPLPARMAAVADAWDAMTSDRPYRGALAREEALRHLRTLSGGQWEPESVEIFLHLLDRGEVDEIVRRQLEGDGATALA